MTRKELEHVRSVLTRIKSEHPHIKEAISYIDKDIARREAQRKEWKDYDSGYDWPFYGQ